jgi:hypothetical protein
MYGQEVVIWGLLLNTLLEEWKLVIWSSCNTKHSTMVQEKSLILKLLIQVLVLKEFAGLLMEVLLLMKTPLKMLWNILSKHLTWKLIKIFGLNLGHSLAL